MNTCAQPNLEEIINISKEAGAAILAVYNQDYAVVFKDDQSPLTQADLAAHHIIVSRLASAYPNIPIVSEEDEVRPYSERQSWSRFWLVDPLDGTKEFINRSNEFTVNIALIENGVPVLGVVYAPALDKTFSASAGQGAFVDGVQLKANDKHLSNAAIKVVASKSHFCQKTQTFIEALTADGRDFELVNMGSSLKICMLAEGAADVYPRLGPTMEWDTAAAHAILLEAGGTLQQCEGFGHYSQFVYNKESLLNPAFVATSSSTAL